MTNHDAPVSTLDPFDSADADRRLAQYRELRDIGPVVYLEKHDVYAVSRYDDVKSALRDWETYRSGEGVGFTDAANQATRGTTLASDPPEHDVLRRIVASGLRPRAVESRRDFVVSEARRVVDEALELGTVDAVTALAGALPLNVIPDFLGLPARNRDKLIEWAQGGTDLLGPPSDRTPGNIEMTMALAGFTREVVANREVDAGTLTAGILDAADRGVIPVEQCPALFIDYLGPSIETTATAIGHLIVLFARHPDQWELLRAAPQSVHTAIEELVRFESPIRGFTRLTSQPSELGGTAIPSGVRVWPIVASANRDERAWDRPDEFDVLRDPNPHLGFGSGVHGCAGQPVARLELHALVHALLDRVAGFELTADPVASPNSMLNAWESVPVRLIPV